MRVLSPEGAGNRLACSGDGRAVGDDAVGLFGRAVLEGVQAQGVKSVVGLEVALEEAIGGGAWVGSVGLVGAFQLGDGFVGGCEEFGVEELSEGLVRFWALGACGELLEELLEVVYWVCYWVSSIGLLLCVDWCFHSVQEIPDGAFFCQGVGAAGEEK